MKVEQLIKKLEQFDPELEILIEDSSLGEANNAKSVIQIVCDNINYVLIS